MATNLVNDFRTKNRIYGEGGGFFGKSNTNVSIDTTGKILSAGYDLYNLFATGASTAGDLVFGSGLSASSSLFDGSVTVNLALSDRVVADAFVGNLSGKAASAEVLATARTISLGQDVTGSASFDGSTNITINATVSTAIYAKGDSAYTTVNAGSATWYSTYSTINAQSAANASAYTTINAQSAANDSVYSTVNAKSANWDSVYTDFNAQSPSNVSVYSTVNTNSASWNSTYSTVNAQSAANASVYSSYNTQSAALFNSASSPSQGTVRLLTQNLVTFDVDTGLQTGDSPQFAGLTVTGNSTITGNLSVLGDIVYIDSTVTTTSALSVVNSGTGPAIYARQTGVNPIAVFVDKEGGQITFADTGSVGIGTDAPGEKLSVVGNISASGNITVGGTATIGTLAAGSTDAVVTQESGTLKTRTIDSRVWGSTLLDGSSLTTNKVTKVSDSNTLVDGNITDTGTSIDLGSNTTVTGTLSTNSTATAAGVTLQNAAKDKNLSKKYISTTVGTGGTAVTTYSTTNLAAAKFTVVLVNGNNRTAFEVLAAVETGGNTTSGTVYAIIDNQAQTQLTDVDVSISAGNLILTITSFANSTTALIEGTAFYNG